MSARISLRVLCLLSLLGAVLVPTAALAQSTTSTLKGVVVDQADTPLAGVHLVLTSDNLQGGREMNTGEDGRFRFMALPPGTYRLDVEKEGFKMIIRPSLTVSLGRTVSLKMIMELPEVGETVTVIDRRPVVDTEQTTQSITLNQDFLRNLPSGRSFQDAVQFLPGVTGGSNPNINGGGMQQNQYYLDGTATSDPVLGTFSMNFNFDAIEDLEVITAGYDARYNQGLGGTINIVTKSGGNTFEADVNAYYQTSAFQSRGGPLIGYAPTNPSSNLELNASLGGPIVKDRFWFFVSYRFGRGIFQNNTRADVGRDYSRYPLIPRKSQTHQILAKLTAQPFARNKFTFSFRADPTEFQNIQQSVMVLPEAEGLWRQGGFSTSLEHQAQIGGRAVLTTLVNYQYSTINVQPMLWQTCDKRLAWGYCTDEDKQTSSVSGLQYGLSSGSYGFYNMDRRHRLSGKMDFELSVDRALGSHTIYAGFEVNPNWTIQRVGYVGNESFVNEPVDVDGDGIPNSTEEVSNLDAYEPVYRTVGVADHNRRESGWLIHGYVQDRWNPFRGMTINIGGRFVKSMLNNNTRDTILNLNAFSGGIGFAWDPFRDGKTRLSGNLASIADPGTLSLSAIANQSNFAGEFYNWDASQQKYSEESNRANTPGSDIVHPDIVVPRTNEILVSVQREVARDLTAQVDFLYRTFTHLWEDDEVNTIWNAAGTDTVGSRNGQSQDVFRLRSPQIAKRNYYSFTLLVRKQLSDNFELLGSYTFSRTVSNTSGSSSGDRLGRSGDFDNPVQRYVENGISAADRPHVVKLSAVYDNPNVWKLAENFSMGYSLGAAFEFASGTPLDRLQWNDWYRGYSNYVFKRGTRERLPAYANLDIKATLAMSIAGKRIDIILQIENLLNTTEVAAASGAAIGQYGQITRSSKGGPLFAQPVARYLGRRFEIGARFSF